jgi:hypothetical protein
MNFRNIPLSKLIPGVVIILFAVAVFQTIWIPRSFFNVSRPLNAGEPEQTPLESFPVKEVPDNTPVDPETVISREFDSHITTGRIFYHLKQYRKAVNRFQQAESLRPEDPLPRYYLMLCYLNLEDLPYSGNSMTIRMALELTALAPGTDMADAAERVLQDYIALNNDEINDNLSPIRAELTARNNQAQRRFVMDGETRIDVFPGNSFDENQDLVTLQPEKDNVESSSYDDNRPHHSPSDKAYISGFISRPDENSQLFKPSGMKINLISTDDGRVYSTTTDERGNFHFTDVEPAGSYVLSAVSRYTYMEYVNNIEQPINDKTIDSEPGKNEESSETQPADENKKEIIETPVGSSDEKPSDTYTAGDETEKPPRHDVSLPPTDPLKDAANQDSSPGMTGSYNTVKPVERHLNFSWHITLNLNEPGIYRVFLNPDNADETFISAIPADMFR